MAEKKQYKSVYFVGAGGIGMAALVRYYLSKGLKVAGYDRTRTALTDELTAEGAEITYDDAAELIPGYCRDKATTLVVYTPAVPSTHPGLTYFRDGGFDVMKRAQVLGLLTHDSKGLCFSGTHGKTTTTSMVSEILLHAGTDPTLSIGGMLKSIGGNIRVGSTDLFVTEACEYTNSFLSFFPRIGMILNIEEDHLDFFKDLEDIRNSFHKFAKLLPADGCLIINGAIDRLQEITGDLDCRVITFNKEAVNSDGSAADYYPSDITFDEFGHPSFTLHRHGEVSGSFSLQVPGEHNVCNAIASIALADLLKIDREVTASALHGFTGTDRRFEYKGTIGGVTIVDDYAHHPTEIAATLHAAANYPHKTLWCVFQPHTYTRTKAFMKDFAKALSLADKVVLADIYAARETDTLGISSETLQTEIRALGHECYYFPSFDEIENFLLENCINGDLLITMGAGDVVKIGENLLGK